MWHTSVCDILGGAGICFAIREINLVFRIVVRSQPLRGIGPLVPRRRGEIWVQEGGCRNVLR